EEEVRRALPMITVRVLLDKCETPR
ncbi:hypothetical protein CFC21_086929, partial [Triticum aestivum]